jgi:hypothetical protein
MSNWNNSSVIPDTITDDEKRIFQSKYIKYCTERENYVRKNDLKLYYYCEYGCDNISANNYPINVYFKDGIFYCVTENYDEEPSFYIYSNDHILERFLCKEQFDKYFVDTSNIVSNNTKY